MTYESKFFDAEAGVVRPVIRLLVPPRRVYTAEGKPFRAEFLSASSGSRYDGPDGAAARRWPAGCFTDSDSSRRSSNDTSSFEREGR